MGRPSLVAVRQEQILDAVQHCVIEYGLAGTTLLRVAARADVQPSLIRHYLGNKQAVMRAAVRRALGNVQSAIADALEGVPDERRLSAQLDVLFDPGLAVPHINQVIDELIAASYRDPETRRQVAEMYSQFDHILRASVAAAYPNAPEERRTAVAHGLLALAHASATFEWLDFDRTHYDKSRWAAEQLLAGLPDCASAPPRR